MKTFLFACVSFGLAASASAEIIGVEQFDYPDGAVAGRNGGTFWDYKNFAPVGHTGVVSNWDDVFGTPAVNAGRLSTSNSGAKREYNGANEADGAVNDPGSVPSSVAHSVYYRVTVTIGGTVPDFFVLSSYDFGTERIYFGKPFGQPNFGLGVGSGPDTNTGPAVQPNTTYLLVARLDYSANTIRLYVDPDLNAPEVSATPAAIATYNDTFWSTALRLASGSGDPIIWDDLVVATTWDDLGTVVTTAVDEDSGSINPNARPDSIEPDSVVGVGVSLREALKYSPSGTLITFAPALSGRTIMLTLGELVPAAGRTLTVDASSLPLGLTIDGNNASRLFFMNNGQRLTLRSLNLTGGNGIGAVSSGLGGAIHNTNTVLRLLGCTLRNNRGTFGGAVYTSIDTGGFSTTLDHCTMVGNSATQKGGAIYNDIGPASLNACTVFGNMAPPGGGSGVASFGDSFTETFLNHTIVCANAGGDVQLVTQTAVNSFTSQGHNLIGTGNAIGDFNQPGDQVGVTNPKLTVLGYFGGPTMTMHPLIGSPAIDAGSAATFGDLDQRGFSRFVDGDNSSEAQVDIGAVEAGSLLLVNSANDSSGATLRIALAFASLVRGTRVGFDPSVFPASITLTQGEINIAAGRSIFIDGSNLSGPVTVSGNHVTRFLNIAGGASGAIHRLNIINGQAANGSSGGGSGGDGGDGGAIRSDGALTLMSCSVTNSRAGDGGDGNMAGITSGGRGGRGGGIFSNGPISLVSSTISDNRSGKGGRGYSGGSGGGHGGNGGNGGGVFASNVAALAACNVSGNLAGAGGNVPTSGEGATGGQGGSGGGIFSSDTLMITTCNINENLTGGGGSVFTDANYFQSPGFAGDGGGISNNAVLRIASSSISGNATGLNGTGGSGAFSGLGGGVSTSGVFSIASCTIANNQAQWYGGGVFAGLGNGGTLTHVTIVGNSSVLAAGGGFAAPANNGLAAHYSIVSQNSPDDTSGLFVNDNNLIGGQPLLAPLGDYGGLTFTMALKPGSPARNAATDSTITADQRGFSIIGVPDIGAYEAGTITNFNAYIWETLPADATEAQHAANADFDGDGQSNSNEFTAGTDAASSASVFRMTITRNQPGFTLTFPTVLGRRYRLQQSFDFVLWTDLLSAINGTGNPISEPVGTGGFDKIFFRARIEP